jgi:poly(3-hydroxybutyrate) depolymerase
MKYRLACRFETKQRVAVLLLSAVWIASGPAQADFIKGQRLTRDSAAANSEDRRYSLYIPTGYQAGTKVPLVVVLHGCRQSDLAMVDKSRMHAVAEADGYIVLYPFMNTNSDGTGPNDDDGRNPNCWGYWIANERARGRGEVHDIVRMVERVKQDYSIDADRVHITGISSGGAMANIAQVAYPDIFASSVLVEAIAFNETANTYTGRQACATVINNPPGWINRDAAAIIGEMRSEMQKSVLRQAPVMVVHNKFDCTVPISVGENLVRTWASLRSADGQEIDTGTPVWDSGLNSTDGLKWRHRKFGVGPNNESLLETVIFEATADDVIDAGVARLTVDPYAPSSNEALREDRERGHWWAGGERGPWIIDKGPNMAQLAWAFFKTHPNCIGAACNGGNGTPPPLKAGPGTWVQETDPALIGQLRNVWVYWPKNPAPAVLQGKRALMLSLHGCNQTAPGHVIDRGFNWEAVAEQYGMVIVAPTKPDTPRSGTGEQTGSTCFDWFDETPHSRTNRDSVHLLKLVAKLKERPDLAIDPKQVYVSGLSGGAAQAQLIACLAPDVFSGVGFNEGPTIGSPGIAGSSPRTREEVRATCLNHAGALANFLDKQVFSIACGDRSGFLPFCQNTRDAYRLMWSANTANPAVNVPGGPGGGGTSTTFSDANGVRIDDVLIPNMDHAWPAGPGGSRNGGFGTWIDNTRIGYPAHLTKFLFDNNLWHRGIPAASCSKPPAGVNASPVTVSCSGTDRDGSVVAMHVAMKDAAGTKVVDESLAGSRVDKSYGLPDGSYTLEVIATDNENLSSATFAVGFSVGPPGADQPPVVTRADASISDGCMAVDGSVSDDNAVAEVAVKVDGAVDAQRPTLTDGNFAWRKCGYGPATYALAAIAVDSAGQRTERATTPASLTVPAVSCISDLNGNHIAGGRAYTRWWGVYARGSNDYLGWVWFAGTSTTSLRRSGADTWIRVASCP